MRSIRTLALVAVAVVAPIAGCGDPDGGTAGSTDSASPSRTAEPTSPEPTSPEPTSPEPTSPEPTSPETSADPTDDPPEETADPELTMPTTLEGVVEAGVEAGCLLLDGFLLLGGAVEGNDLLTTGSEVRVTGFVEQDVMTTCQQGTPFRVETVEPLG